MNVHFHPQAELELSDTVDYYDRCEFGLGLEFAEEVYSTLERIDKYPAAGQELSRHTRRCLVNRFPYGVIYQIMKQSIRIIAIANLHRRPDYWQKRV